MRLHDYLDHRAASEPQAELATTGSSVVTCEEAAAYVGRLCAALVAAGLEVGARVGYLSKNSVEFGLFYYAASKAGVVAVPLNYRLVPREWAYILGDAGVQVLFAQSEYTGGIDSVRDQLAHVRRYVCIDGDTDADSDADSGSERWEPMGAWLDATPLDRAALLERGCDDVYQMYTSGTTGRPKGVVISQAALLCTLMQWRLTLPLARGERALIVAPTYHVSGALNLFHAVASGGSVYLMREFDPAEAARVLDAERIGYVMLVPAMIQSILTDVPDAGARRYADLRTILYGGSAISEATLRRALDVFGCDLVQAFGMTEMPNIVYLTAADHRRALAGRPELLLAAGRPGPGSWLKIVDEHDEEVPPGTVGEICGRGDQVMARYWNLPEATAEALRGGWMHTGDAGAVDDEGYLFIMDRIKDMICSGGENVYPREVEEVLFEHPAVADAAVIGVPSERWGETVHGIVVLRAGHDVAEAEIVEFCVGRLAGFKRPRTIAFVAELPRNPSGKVLKQELRAAAWEGHTRTVG
jgi:acyl-CoA synthetase (AMP-forming)/AMP-acid ligase II